MAWVPMVTDGSESMTKNGEWCVVVVGDALREVVIGRDIT